MNFRQLRLLDDDGPREAGDSAPEPPVSPKVLVRIVAAPPGLPWDQARVADLEARHGSPLPMSEVLYRLRRLETWRPGAPARFAAFYVIARDVVGRCESVVDVEGRPTRVSFLSRSEQAALTRRLAIVGLTIGLSVAIVLTAVGSALVRRTDTVASLNEVDLRLAGKARSLDALEKLRRQQQALDAAPGRGAPVGAVAADVAWAVSAKTPESHIDALHWQPGLMAFEVRGAAPPFSAAPDKLIERAPRPLRPGVWLWGVTERPLVAPTQGPVAAPLKGGAP